MSAPGGAATEPAFVYRRGRPADALILSVLATQVFLDTYATRGIDADLAAEVTRACGLSAFGARLADPQVEITLAQAGGGAVGFLDLSLRSPCPVEGVVGAEVLRLYVQAPFQRQGVGRALLARAEAQARALGAPSIWLTAWVGNARALLFYASVGYEDVGVTPYLIEGRAYENRVFAKSLGAGRAAQARY